MTIEQRLTDYRHRLWDTERALENAKAQLHKLKTELRECEIHGEIPTTDLMNDLKAAETCVDWYDNECYELRIEIEECEAALADDDE